MPKLYLRGRSYLRNMLDGLDLLDQKLGKISVKININIVDIIYCILTFLAVDYARSSSLFVPDLSGWGLGLDLHEPAKYYTDHHKPYKHIHYRIKATLECRNNCWDFC